MMLAIIRIRWDLPWIDPATGADRFPERKTAEWQAARRALFERYTLPSLRRQRHRSWEAWLLADPAIERGGDPDPLATFETNAYATARAIRGPVFLCRLDSDDMLAPEALATMIAATEDMEGKTYVQLDTGVAWATKTRTLYRWVNPSPPFYGRIVSDTELQAGLPGLGHHGKVRPECKVIVTEGPMFCVGLHGGNISNSPDGRWAQDVIVGEERARIMERFGLED